jgi:hypothetical protein
MFIVLVRVDVFAKRRCQESYRADWHSTSYFRRNEGTMSRIIWLRYQQHIGWQTIMISVVTVCLLFSVNCRNEHTGTDSMHQNSFPRFFLVVSSGHDKLVWNILAIDDLNEARKMDAWTQEHVTPNPANRRSRALILTWWHDELLRLDERGKVVWAADLADPGVISGKDQTTLEEIFARVGKQVSTVPRRIPPRQQNNDFFQIPIEYEDTAVQK